MSYTRAYHFLEYVKEHPEDFPTWGMRTLFHEDFSYEALEWLGPGHAVLWTPHALERLIERIELDYKGTQDFGVISNLLKQCSAQISFSAYRDDRGRFSFSPGTQNICYTFALDFPPIASGDRVEILIKTFIAEKRRALQCFEIHNALAMGPHTNLANLGEQDLWSDERKAAYKEHVQNLPDPICRYSIRLWLLQIAHISRDLEIIPQAFNLLLTNVRASQVVPVAQMLFLEDECGLRDIGLRMYRYAVQIKTGVPRTESFHTICDDFLKNPLEMKKTYVQTLRYLHRYSKLRVSITDTERVSDLDDLTLEFRGYVKTYGSKTICKILSISRNAASNAYWDASGITEEMWQTLHTLPPITGTLQEECCGDTAQQEC